MQHELLLDALDAIRPALQADGGDIKLVEVHEDTGVIDVELVGACGSCPMSTMTLKAGIERILKDRVPGVTEVRAINVEEGLGGPLPWEDEDDDAWAPEPA